MCCPSIPFYTGRHSIVNDQRIMHLSTVPATIVAALAQFSRVADPQTGWKPDYCVLQRAANMHMDGDRLIRSRRSYAERTGQVDDDPTEVLIRALPGFRYARLVDVFW